MRKMQTRMKLINTGEIDAQHGRFVLDKPLGEGLFYIVVESDENSETCTFTLITIMHNPNIDTASTCKGDEDSQINSLYFDTTTPKYLYVNGVSTAGDIVYIYRVD